MGEFDFISCILAFQLAFMVQFKAHVPLLDFVHGDLEHLLVSEDVVTWICWVLVLC
jgi:hypothetical protein